MLNHKIYKVHCTLYVLAIRVASESCLNDILKKGKNSSIYIIEKGIIHKLSIPSRNLYQVMEMDGRSRGARNQARA